jgi:enoyl-CoA hydratase
MNYNTLLYSINNNIGLVTINRPDKLNALNHEVLDELRKLFGEIKNDPDVAAVILTGSGKKAFVAGADISELNKLDVLSGKEFAEYGQEVFNEIESLGKPVIGAINGYALGGGCELALACHIRLAGENAKFGQPEVNLGIIPGYGGTQRLPRLINSGRALEMILTGDMIDAQEAYRIGLVNKLYPDEELLSKAQEFAEKISSKGHVALKMALKAVVSSDELSEKEGLHFEASLFAVCCGSDDFKEGTSAFLEKRKPEFTGK